MKKGASAWLGAAALALAGAWAYAPALRGDWLWDDRTGILQNRLLRDPAGLLRIWLGPAGPDYFPLKSTVQWLQWHCWGPAPFGYHATNLVLHVAAGLLLWRLLDRLRRMAAPGKPEQAFGWPWFGALLFVIHPLAVESVAWISELKNTLSLPLLLLAFGAYLDYDERGRRRDIARALLWFVAAMLAKTSVAMLPAGLLLYAWWRRGRISRRDLGAAAGFFIVSLVLGGITVWVQRHRAIAGAELGLGGAGDRWSAAGLALAFYVEKALWPAGLFPIYPRWAADPLALRSFLPWLALAAGFAWTWRRRAGWGRHALFGAGWFVLNLIPVLGFVPMAYLRISRVADHFAYVSLLAAGGLAMALGEAAAARLKPRRRLPIAAAAAVAALFAWQSRRLAANFASEERFWNYALAGNPAAWPAHNNLGQVLMKEGRLNDAVAEYRLALEERPDYAEAYNNLGIALFDLERPSEGLADLQKAAELEPTRPLVHYNLARGLSRLGFRREALAEYRIALQLEPDFPEAQRGEDSLLRPGGR